jgi:hypothetical protein
MIKKTLKTAPRKTPQMARQGAQISNTPEWTTGRGLKRALGLIFWTFPNSISLSAISNGFKKVHHFGAKRPFKRSLKGGLKIFAKNGQSHYPRFSIFRQNRRFCHVKMV